MKIINKKLHLSATDMSNHLACGHLTQLELRKTKGELDKPVRNSPFLDRIKARGIEHEAAYVRYLKTDGNKTVLEIAFEDPDAKDKTRTAMHQGVDVIVQGSLGNDTYGGRPDFLLKKAYTSPTLGDWSYEAADTKLTRTTKAGTMLQLCVYSDLISEIQGAQPKEMHVVMPQDDEDLPFHSEPHRYDDYAAYFRLIKKQLINVITETPDKNSYPEPVSHCDICQWWPDCDKQRRNDDHLSYVAGIQKTQIKELKLHNINTLTELATTSKDAIQQLETGSPKAIDNVRMQAKIQHKGITSGEPEYEFLDIVHADEGNKQLRGFLRLPEPDSGDLFFDIESARHAPGGGLEYLLGFVEGNIENPEFNYFWGLNKKDEKSAFKKFVDLATKRAIEFPDMHIYHFAPYEPAALKRLASRHSTHENELDNLLRSHRFIDLYAVARQGIRASVESYSIKCLEQFYGYERKEELAEARLSMHHMEALLEMGASSEVQETHKDTVLQYNRDDCVSTLALRNWLEDLRKKLIATGVDVPRPPTPVLSDEVKDNRSDALILVFNKLTSGLENIDETDRNPDESARWLLAHSLDYFNRERKNAWWEYFRLRELDDYDLSKERFAIAGLTFQSEVIEDDVVLHRYSYEPQFITLDNGDTLYETSSEAKDLKECNVGTVAAIDLDNGTVDIKRKAPSEDVHPTGVFHHQFPRLPPLDESILDFGQTVSDAYEGGISLNAACYDLLAKRPPRFRNNVKIPSNIPAENLQKVAYELISNLDNSVLAIQGPPGTGKTYTGSSVILKLASGGKRIGITGGSHAVIANLLNGIYKAADGEIKTKHKGTKKQAAANGCKPLSDNKGVVKALDEGHIVGGTAWTWASEPLQENPVDYLFVDEAGQMSLATALAAGRGAKNIVMLGDPQQLEQPQKAAHPEGSHIAALTHLIDGKQTVSEDQGLFLNTTYRMHPRICQFTSEQYYEAKLTSHSDRVKQIINGSAEYTGKQLCFIPIDHNGNQSRSDEETIAIQETITTLLDGSHQWTTHEGVNETLNAEHILVVAPYNAQVELLKRTLGENPTTKEVSVGTVDKFQGQEAPIVIYSLTSSSSEDAPRGMSFLFSPNRFNVATSRARCTVLVFGSPHLATAECKTPEQIRWANGLCRYLEMAT